MTKNQYPDILSEQERKNRLGKILEKWIYAILKILFPSVDGYRIIHPDWGKNYNNDHKGADFRVFHRCKEILAIECKNWRKLSTKYGVDIVERDIIPRFYHIGTHIRICVISFLDALTTTAIRHAQAQGIQFINLDKLIGRKAFKTQLFHIVKAEISKFLVQPTRRVLDSSIQSTLTTSANTVVGRGVVDKSHTGTLNNTVSVSKDREAYLESIIVKLHIEHTHPCFIDHPDHRKWMDKQLDLAERYSQ